MMPTVVDPGTERRLMALATSYLEARTSLLLSAPAGRQWSSATVTLTPRRWASLPGGRVAATVVEHTRLDRASSSSARSVSRTFEFEPHPGGWRILDHYLEQAA
jgi:hypothetical protein